MDNIASPRDMGGRDRNRRGDRQSRFSDAGGGGGNNGDRDRDRSRERRGPTSRIYVSNIPYEYRWQDLKDLCRDLVGDVNFVELFNDEHNKPRGCGIVEFKNPDSVAAAMEKLNRHEINGRHLVIKEDHGDERDEFGRVIRGSTNRGRGMNSGGGGGGGGGYNQDRDDDRPRPNLGGGGGNIGGVLGGNSGGGGGGGGALGGHMGGDSPYNTYGLSTSFLEGLGIQGPLYNKIFVANLDYTVNAKKLKQVFKLAGRIVSVDLSADKDGNSRGFAVVEYEHPVEAVQAISMFDRQVLFDRRMTVRLDRIPEKGESLKLPDGLKGIGIGLGQNGEPLKNVAYNLMNMTSKQNNPPSASAPMNGGGGGGGNVGLPSSVSAAQNQNAALTSAAAAASLLGPAPNNPLGGLTNLAAVMSNLSGSLNNPLLNSSLSNLGLGLANSGGGVVGNAGDQNQLGQNQQQGVGVGGGGGVGGGYSHQNPTFQSSYSTPVFNTNLSALRSRSDYDQGNSVRNYSTQSIDYGNRGSAQNSYSNAASQLTRKSDTIIIKNLPPTCNWQTLRDKFREMGEVKHAEMRGLDTGIVRFADEKDAEMAIKFMDGARFDNQTVYVSFF